ncbi:AAA family ATPase [Fictibacillus sp. b24]|uniref:AAA family ATPase n=1 Tax=Fictibacillus sp. b24 TaxID=3055863 RepID=UPI0025A175AC|nr:AAA family ATPase [Fictibacillus sp. b24]MDM5316854.1 AAA family ATPase [Fictibacillus sp. b24]
MRPISLTVSGLQSFREAQSVPFHELCSGGVFGIFGPTGSGKSTILDAVTLALYGKVERAAGGTHGIMNQAEDKLSVSFSFQLGEGVQQKEYTVERSFKRSGEHTIRTSTCRLIETVSEESVVHADKERDVTRLVQELIGLTIDDFTRAVVLPQGKFAEFLSLKGADRRQMLQRLFQLEKYGDVLNHKLKKRSDEQRNRSNEITAEQAGLGDASSESLESAAIALKEKAEKLKKISERMQQEDENVKSLELFWEAQVQHEKLMKEQSELKSQQTDMELLQVQLKRAVHADKIYPYANEWNASVSTERKISDEHEELKKRTESLKVLFSESEEKYEAAKKKRNHQEPILIEKRSSLKEAFDWEKELDDKSRALKREAEKHDAFVKAYKESEKAETDASDVLKRGKDKQTALKTELSKIEVTQKDRSIYQQAILLSQRLKDVEAEHQKLLGELTATESELKEVEQTKESIQKALSETFDKGKKLTNSIQRLYDEIWNSVRRNEQLTTSLQNELKERKSKQEQIRIHHLAAQLSAELKENEPCSVCGSTVHPSPIQYMKDTENHEEEIQELETAYEVLKRLDYDLKHNSEVLEKSSQKVWNRLDFAAAETAASNQSMTIDEIEKSVAFSFLEFENHTAKVKGIQQDRIQIEEQVDSWLNQLDDEQKKSERLSSTIDNSLNQKEKLGNQISSLTEKNEELLSEWKQSDIPFEPDMLTDEQNQFQIRENRQADILKSLTVAEEFLEQQAKKLESAKEEKSRLHSEMNVSSSQQEMLKQDVQAIKDKIYKRVGEQTVQVAFEEIEKQLNDLKSKYSLAEQGYEKANHQYVECDKAYHSVVQQLKDAQIRKEKAEQEWNKHLSSSDFRSYEEFESCLKNEEVQIKWEHQITQYQDQCKTNASALDEIKGKLPSELLSIEQVQSAKEQLLTLIQETNDTREAVGEARQIFITIENNHKRYNELQEEKDKVSHLLEQLGKLQSVFRGNAFVEFMAEEQLHLVTRDASSRLSKLTRGRYAIEVDSSGGFVIRDDANGGIKRPVTSLSGGETFLTSLSLALSLSAQIQLRGKFPLQFFFLDEGFGTLDQELLDTVVTALEKVQMENFSIGVISHIPELKARLTKRLIVEPAEHSGRGTRVRLDQV